MLDHNRQEESLHPARKTQKTDQGSEELEEDSLLRPIGAMVAEKMQDPSTKSIAIVKLEDTCAKLSKERDEAVVEQHRLRRERDEAISERDRIRRKCDQARNILAD
eukprot:TRINITY_DN5235_c0_g1_i1.p1 TRINITY_DN5235_c0_g1~~TRINITY_DN5235_c0_g1_i1.p1  ORF type:complete len:106 (+),score=14.78 TRINITY_DN5235_c0_g1_i1:436-753(+)